MHAKTNAVVNTRMFVILMGALSIVPQFAVAGGAPCNVSGSPYTCGACPTATITLTWPSNTTTNFFLCEKIPFTVTQIEDKDYDKVNIDEVSDSIDSWTKAGVWGSSVDGYNWNMPEHLLDAYDDSGTRKVKLEVKVYDHGTYRDDQSNRSGTAVTYGLANKEGTIAAPAVLVSSLNEYWTTGDALPSPYDHCTSLSPHGSYYARAYLPTTRVSNAAMDTSAAHYQGNWTLCETNDSVPGFNCQSPIPDDTLVATIPVGHNFTTDPIVDEYFLCISCVYEATDCCKDDSNTLIGDVILRYQQTIYSEDVVAGIYQWEWVRSGNSIYTSCSGGMRFGYDDVTFQDAS